MRRLVYILLQSGEVGHLCRAILLHVTVTWDLPIGRGAIAVF